MLVGERADLLTIDADRTDQLVLLEHRHDQQSPGASKASNRLIGIFHENIGNVDHLFRIGDAVKETCPATRNDWIALSVGGVCLRRVVQRNASESIALIQVQIAELGAADAYRVGQHGREHRLQVARRAGDDLEHLGGRGLLLPSLSELAPACFELLFRSAPG